MADTLKNRDAGTLTADDVGDRVVLAGWVARRRDHGGVVFVDLRDQSGVVQVVLNPEGEPASASDLQGLRSEFCISVEGIVRLRPADMANPELPTGEIEVAADTMAVLSPSEPLPFQIDDRSDVDEAK
ncbi:MAG: OB-fold nucleic acid binding domain-containing protein, partial [Acidimicrobiia bacterium]